MKPKTKGIRPWSKLSQEEREARVLRLRGKFAGVIGTTDDFLAEKQAELEREESRFSRRSKK
jgi:hypothetical protein